LVDNYFTVNIGVLRKKGPAASFVRQKK